MYAELTAAFSSLKSASELAALVLKRKTDSAVRQKAIELQSDIIALHTALSDAQTKYRVALEETDRLKQELVDLKNWEIDAAKYELVKFAEGTLVYAPKPDQLGTSPMHYLCPKCYVDKYKSILQKWKQTDSGWVYPCPQCKTHYYGPEPK